MTETNVAETVHAESKEEYSSIGREAIAERASLGKVDRPSPYDYSAIFISVTI